MKKIILAFLAAAFLFTGNSCTKTGPQGPQGPTGNANVRGSASFNVYSNTWSYSGNTYSANFLDPDITPDVANYGIVEVFKYYPSDGTWSNLPDINGPTSTVFNFKAGEFTIYINNTDGTATPVPASTLTFRAVAITSSFKQAHPKTNWKNYNEVMAAIAETKNQTSDN